MDFFERQDQARKKTQWLGAYFTAGVLLTIVAVYLVFALIYAKQFAREDGLTIQALWHPKLFLYVSLGTLAVVAGGSLFKIAELSHGGSSVATALGGRLVPAHTNDPEEKKLRNIVEEMSLASGVPVPEIYVLDREPGINAFAAGSSTTDAAIGVTRGAIHLLARDELQGVIAHEFSHILNGDMRLNLRLIGWVHGILCLAIIGRVLLHTRSSSRSDKKGGNPLPLIGLCLIAIGGIGVFFGRLIKAAISRQREFLADAAAVQFTRNPGGLAGALKKIGTIAYGSRLESPAAEEASHMFFGNGLGESWFQAFATHPPLTERIRLLEPAFTGTFPQIPSPSQSGLAPQKSRKSQPPPMPAVVKNIAPADFVASAGAPTPAHLTLAADLIQSLPPTLQAAVREPFGATALVYSLLLSPNTEARNAQLKELHSHIDAPLIDEMKLLADSVQQLQDGQKLPVVELAIPALRQLSPGQYRLFVEHLNTLIASDREIDLFEFALQKIISRHLDPLFTAAPQRIVQFYSLRGLADDCAVLLSALAHVGHAQPHETRQAFEAGRNILKLEPGAGLFVPLDQCSLQRIDVALNRLAQSVPQCKRLLLTAAAHTVGFDGNVHPRETELLRAIADTLDCPIPPFVRT